MESKVKKIEEGLIFMGLLTFVGGFINAYSFITRGYAFVSLHTGNMARIGLSICLKDFEMFISAFVPVIGCLVGAILAQIMKHFMKGIGDIKILKNLIWFEVIFLLIIGLIPNSISNNAVNFSLSIITTFQLSNFRKYNGNVHNSTIMTGNLRTFGTYAADLLIKRDSTALKTLLKYSILILAFPIGAALGGIFSTLLSIRSIWICAVLLVYLGFSLKERD